LGNVCAGAADLGQLGNINAAGQFTGIGGDLLFRFYVPQYEVVTGFPLAQLRFSYSYIDDNTGIQLAARHGTPEAPVFVTLDPGYYCLRAFNPMGPGGQFNVQMSGTIKGLRPGATKQMAIDLPLLDVGNLSTNGYYERSRYINDGNINIQPGLTAGHIYTLRDWVGRANGDQFYIFSIDASRTVTVELANLYLGARATIETANGIVGATADAGTPLTPRPPSQKFEGLLPAGTYYLHVAFAGVGGPGTPYSVSLTAR
jgi:hypothetical protein